MLNLTGLNHLMSLQMFSVNVIYPTSLSISKAYLGDFIFFQCYIILNSLHLYIVTLLSKALHVSTALHVSAFSLCSCKL